MHLYFDVNYLLFIMLAKMIPSLLLLIVNILGLIIKLVKTRTQSSPSLVSREKVESLLVLA